MSVERVQRVGIRGYFFILFVWSFLTKLKFEPQQIQSKNENLNLYTHARTHAILTRLFESYKTNILTKINGGKKLPRWDSNPRHLPQPAPVQRRR